MKRFFVPYNQLLSDLLNAVVEMNYFVAFAKKLGVIIILIRHLILDI